MRPLWALKSPGGRILWESLSQWRDLLDWSFANTGDKWFGNQKSMIRAMQTRGWRAVKCKVVEVTE